MKKTNNLTIIPATINFEDVQKLTLSYISKHRNSYPTVIAYYNNDIEDIASDVLLTMFNRGAFDSFEEKNAKLSTYVSTITKNWLFDKAKFLRNNKNGVTYSMDYDMSGEKSNSNSETTLQDTLKSGATVAEEIIDDAYIASVLSTLDELGTVSTDCEGNSPLTGDKALSNSVLVEHLLAGYNLSEIAKFYTNKKTNKPLSRPALAKRLNAIKEEITYVMSYVS